MGSDDLRERGGGGGQWSVTEWGGMGGGGVCGIFKDRHQRSYIRETMHSALNL